MNEREYMMTEGWLWTGQYPECKRILAHGNNQSMELDEGTLNAHWSKDGNGDPQFFIINEAIISKLCTLGENNEPCFEGASIGTPVIQFAFADGFKEQIFSMMNELKDYLTEGGEKVLTRYAVEIGDALWTALYDHVENTYGIESVCEDGEQKFAILTADDKYYRLDFSIAEDGAITFAEEASVMEDYVPGDEPQFSAEAVAEYAKSKKEKESDDEEKSEDGEEKKCPKCGKDKSECKCKKDKDADDDDEDKKKGKKEKYNLEEIQEYVELSNDHSALQEKYSLAQERIEALERELEALTTFKKGVERAEKEKMIASFYMLSDEDKADVVANIDKYSLRDIEGELSILCVRNKVSFNLDEDKGEEFGPTTFNLNGNLNDDVPAWIKAVRSVASDM